MDDLISRKWLVDRIKEGWIGFDTEKDYNSVIHFVRDMALSAQPNLYGYTIEHLAGIARVMEIEGISPQEAIRKFEDTKYICELLIDEIQKKLDEVVKSCMVEQDEIMRGKKYE